MERDVYHDEGSRLAARVRAAIRATGCTGASVSTEDREAAQRELEEARKAERAYWSALVPE